MAGFSISEFKSFAADLIKSAGIDLNGNSKIEAGEETEKLCVLFNIEPDQIGDLLELKQTATKAPTGYTDKELERRKTHEKYLEAKEEYKNMSTDQKQKVCEETIKQEGENLDNLSNAVNYPRLEGGYPLGVQLLNMGNDFQDKDKVIAKIKDYVQSKVNMADEDIKNYDEAFLKYDSTYETPFVTVISSGSVGVNSVNLVRITKPITRDLENMINEFVQSASTEGYEQKVMELVGKVEVEIGKMNEQIDTYKDAIYEKYNNDSNDSIVSLMKQETGEPEDLNLKGAPVEKVFIKVVDETNFSTTGINDVKPTGDPKDGPIYNLSGQRVDGNLQKGQVYIQNGKKFIAE